MSDNKQILLTVPVAQGRSLRLHHHFSRRAVEDNQVLTEPVGIIFYCGYDKKLRRCVNGLDVPHMSYLVFLLFCDYSTVAIFPVGVSQKLRVFSAFSS